MQDKNNIADIDEQFTNLAWENMRGVLDNEMPVAPVRKRRWGWLWLLLFLGVVVGGTYYNFLVKNNVQPNKISETADTKIATVIENTNDINEFETNNEAKPPRTDDFSRRGASSHLTAKVVSTNDTKIGQKKELDNNVVQNNLRIKKESITANKNTNTKQTYSSSPRTNDFSRRGQPSHLTAKVVSTNSSEKEPTKSVAPIVVPIDNLTRNSLGSIKRISTLLLGEITSNDLEINKLATFDPIPKPRKFSQTYSLMTGVRSDEFTDFGGVNAGLLAHYRFTPKVGLETGITYTNLRKNINTYKDFTTEITTEYPDNTQQFDRTLTDALDLDYLRLPISFTYRPHAKIQLAAGINSGYRFAMRNTNTNDIFSSEINSMDNGGSIIVINDTYESSFTVNAESIDLDTSLASNERIDVPYSFTVRKWDLAAQAGLRYYPVPRLGIDLSYQYGLLNMTPNSSINRNSGVQLALVYQLHR